MVTFQKRHEIIKIIRHFKFSNSDFRFVITEPKNSRVRVSRPIQILLGHSFKDEKLKNYYINFIFFL